MKNFTTLDDLSKDDLIKVIANIADSISLGDNGHGFDAIASNISAVGSLCIKKCVESNDWSVPTYKK